jgi:hypothetical protein
VIEIAKGEAVIIFDLPVSAEFSASDAAVLVAQRCVIYRHEGIRVAQMHCGPVVPRLGR